MKNRFKHCSLLILVALFTFSCQKESVSPESEIGSNQTTNSKLKTTEQFEFAVNLFTQDAPNGEVVPASGSLTIESNSAVIYTGELTEGGNRIHTSNEANYTLIVEKEGG